MNDQEIVDRISKVESFAGMTVNEMLYHCNLDKEFYDSINSDKIVAEKILQLLKIGQENINSILNKNI